MKSIYEQISEEYFDEAVKTIIRLVNVNSVYDETTVDEVNPYGKGVTKVLNTFKDIALEHNIHAEVLGNRCVELTIGDTGREVGIFAHLDVVPASGEWSSDPFDAQIRDNKIYGRGTSDDKGPLVCSFYSIVGLIKHGLVNNYKIRFVAGGDEERGSSCLEYYFDTLKKPVVDCGFTPDADFPLIYGEKGIINYTLVNNDLHIDDDLISIEAGVASNCVIDKARVIVKDLNKLISYLDSINATYHVEENSVVFDGKSAHGSTPELGINSGIAMLFALGNYYHNQFLLNLANQYDDYNGRNIEQCYESKNMGITTYNVGLISYNKGLFSMTINFRFPEILDIEEFKTQIKEISPCDVEFDRVSPVLYFDPESKMIQTLYKAYVEESGDTETKMMTIGGGTYAKEAKNIVAFGSKFPGKEDHIHEPDEKIDLEDVKKSIQLYARAIYDLGNM